MKRAPVILVSSRVLSTFLTPVKWNNLLLSTYDLNVLTHPNEEFDHRLFRDAPVVSPPPVSVFHYIDLYPTFLYLVRSRHMPTDSN